MHSHGRFSSLNVARFRMVADNCQYPWRPSRLESSSRLEKSGLISPLNRDNVLTWSHSCTQSPKSATFWLMKDRRCEGVATSRKRGVVARETNQGGPHGCNHDDAA